MSSGLAGGLAPGLDGVWASWLAGCALLRKSDGRKFGSRVAAAPGNLLLEESDPPAGLLPEFLVQESYFAHKHLRGINERDADIQVGIRPQRTVPPEGRRCNSSRAVAPTSRCYLPRARTKSVPDIRSCQVRPSLSNRAQPNPSNKAAAETR